MSPSRSTRTCCKSAILRFCSSCRGDSFSCALLLGISFSPSFFLRAGSDYGIPTGWPCFPLSFNGLLTINVLLVGNTQLASHSTLIITQFLDSRGRTGRTAILRSPLLADMYCRTTTIASWRSFPCLLHKLVCMHTLHEGHSTLPDRSIGLVLSGGLCYLCLNLPSKPVE